MLSLMMLMAWQVDPQLEWIMSVRMRKPWHQWVEQLFSDESVEAQVCM